MCSHWIRALMCPFQPHSAELRRYLTARSAQLSVWCSSNAGCSFKVCARGGGSCSRYMSLADAWYRRAQSCRQRGLTGRYEAGLDQTSWSASRLGRLHPPRPQPQTITLTQRGIDTGAFGVEGWVAFDGCEFVGFGGCRRLFLLWLELCLFSWESGTSGRAGWCWGFRCRSAWWRSCCFGGVRGVGGTGSRNGWHQFRA